MAVNSPQEDLSMEEILSSIRNILMEGGQAPAAKEREESPGFPAGEEIEDLNAGDSVFDLSREMRVEDRPVIEYSPLVEAAESFNVPSIDDLDSLLGADELSIDDIGPDIGLGEPSLREEELLLEDEDDALMEGLESELQADIAASAESVAVDSEKGFAEAVQENIKDEMRMVE